MKYHLTKIITIIVTTLLVFVNCQVKDDVAKYKKLYEKAETSVNAELEAQEKHALEENLRKKEEEKQGKEQERREKEEKEKEQAKKDAAAERDRKEKEKAEKDKAQKDAADQKAKDDAAEKAKQEEKEQAEKDKAQNDATDQNAKEDEAEKAKQEEKQRREQEEAEKKRLADEAEKKRQQEEEAKQGREQEEQQKRQQEEEKKKQDEQAKREEEENKNVDKDFLDTFNKLEEPSRTSILVIDFTGQDCPSCPPAIKSLTKTKKEMEKELSAPDTYALAFLHTNPYSTKNRTRGTEALYTAESSAYSSKLRQSGYIIKGIPFHLFNSLGSYKESRGVKDMIAPVSSVKRMAEVKVSDRKLSIKYISKITAGNEAKYKSTNLKLVIWLIENNIQAYQYSLGLNFKHDNVFRGTLNGISGHSYKLEEIYKQEVAIPDVVKNEKIKDSMLYFILMDENTGQVFDVLTKRLN